MNDNNKIILSEESMKIVEEAIANPPAPNAKLRELMNRPRRVDVGDLFINPVHKHENDSRTLMTIIKGRATPADKIKLAVSKGELIPPTRTFQPLVDVGVPESMAQKLNLQLMIDYFLKDQEGSFKDSINEMAIRIKLHHGNWCREMIKPMRPDNKIWGERIEGYIQLGVYLKFIEQGLYEHAAFKRMQEMKEDIKFYADAIDRDITIKNDSDRSHWLTWGILILHVVNPLMETGIVDHSKIIFFYENVTRYNLS